MANDLKELDRQLLKAKEDVKASRSRSKKFDKRLNRLSKRVMKLLEVRNAQV